MPMAVVFTLLFKRTRRKLGQHLELAPKMAQMMRGTRALPEILPLGIAAQAAKGTSERMTPGTHVNQGCASIR